jgi:Rad3-related DNA helicase
MNETPLTLAVENAFRKVLPSVLGGAFEERAEQVDMAVLVAEAIDGGRVEVVEAETGLGKSLAYLVPLVLHCNRTGARAVVCTYTKNLQRQLIEKDFPLACRAAGGGVTGAILMGRSNYACRRRIETMVGRGRPRGKGRGTDERIDPSLAAWLSAVLDSDGGELDAMPDASWFLDARLRSMIACPSREAVCAGCRLRDDCFMFKARRHAVEAQIVVTNHALLFSDLAASGALLGPYDVLVVDEAHHLEGVATDFFSLSFSPRSIRGSHQSIYSPEYEETARYIQAMVAGESKEDARAIEESWAVFHDSLAAADEKTAELFSVLQKNAAVVGPGPGGSGRPNGPEAPQALYREGTPFFYGAEAAAGDVSRALARMEAEADRIVEVVGRFESLAESGASGAMKAIRDGAAEVHAEFDFLVSGSADDHVFYAQFESPAGASSLAASPVDVSGRLGAVLEEGCASSAVLTSATLAVGGDFTYTLERMGLSGSNRVGSRRYDSPFDLDAGRVVLLAGHMPEPSAPRFLREAAGLIDRAAGASGRRVLVLCTARSQIAELERRLAASGGAERELFVQNDGVSREDLLARFRRSRRGVLVGLASFWEGVDLPGEELELIVILKLPFMVPTEPVTQARSARLAETGENPFEKLFLPDVVLKLRQGMGRLIRTSRDRGAVVLLDRRLAHSQYGDFVVRAVTNRFVRCDGEREIIEHLNKHFGDE